MTRICLVRHGETDWNLSGKLQGKTDIPLNDNGMAQAKESAAHLQKELWDVIITSPLKRAKGTAEIINQNLQLPFIEMNAFMEKSFGDAEGMTFEERMQSFPSNEYPNQEDRTFFRDRLMQGLEDIKQLYRGKRILLVAHGAVINAILAELSNGEIGSGKTSLHNACLSTIVSGDKQWTIENYNQITHLSDTKAKTALIL